MIVNASSSPVNVTVLPSETLDVLTATVVNRLVEPNAIVLPVTSAIVTLRSPLFTEAASTVRSFSRPVIVMSPASVVPLILFTPIPAVVAPAGSADGSICVTLLKYFVDVAAVLSAPVTTSVMVFPAMSVPVIVKVLSLSSPAEVIVT